MRLLICGAGGQLGRELVRLCELRAITAVAALRTGADIADYDQLSATVRAASPTVIVNAAAFTKVDLAEVEVERAFRENSEGPRVLAEVASLYRIPLVHISTDYVFDGSKQSAYTESDRTAPINVYGASKLSGEEMIRAKTAQHVIIRTAWVYGEFGTNFLKTILALAASSDELAVVADQYGNPTATPDLAQAILSVCTHLAAGDNAWGTYHFAGSGVTTWHGFARAIVAAQQPLTGRNPEIRAIATGEHPTAAARPTRSELDCELFTRTFGLRAFDWQARTKEIVETILRK